MRDVKLKTRDSIIFTRQAVFLYVFFAHETHASSGGWDDGIPILKPDTLKLPVLFT